MNIICLSINRIRRSLSFAVVAIAFSVSTAAMGYAVERLSDTEKRKIIEEMYAEYQKQFPEISDIDPLAAAQLALQKNVIFIDTRNPEEQRVSMLPEAITAKAFMENPEKYRNHIKIAYCTIAYRSGKFAQKLWQKGIMVFNLRGGILAWVHDGGKVVNQNGQIARIHVYGRKWDLAPAAYETIR